MQRGKASEGVSAGDPGLFTVVWGQGCLRKGWTDPPLPATTTPSPELHRGLVSVGPGDTGPSGPPQIHVGPSLPTTYWEALGHSES